MTGSVGETIKANYVNIVVWSTMGLAALLVSSRTLRVFSAGCVSAISRTIRRKSSTEAMTKEPAYDLPPVSYARVPFKDTFLRMGYVDIGSPDSPVVVAIHGAPGGVQDFAALYDPLSSKGLRVVVPEFPGYRHTTIENAKEFDESTEARATLVHNFLTTLGINRVAAIGGHSLGTAAAMHLAANYDYFQSVVYLDGVGFRPHMSVWPYWLTCMYASSLENAVTRPLTKTMLSWAYRMKGYNLNAIETGMETGIRSAAKVGFDQFKENATRVKDKGLPIFFAFTKNDRLIEWELPMEVVKYFGTSEGSISWLDAQEQLVTGASVTDASVSFPWAMIFDRGGHFVHRSHSALVSQRIVSFVEKVVSKL